MLKAEKKLNPLIELKSVSRFYATGIQRVVGLQELDLSIEAGAFTAVIGPSGSGKSTLLNIISLIDEPSSGTVYFDGENLAGNSDDAISDYRNRNIGIVFQNFNLLPVFSARDNVALALKIRGVKKKTANETAEALLAEVGLADHLQHKPDQLSGGQKQRVAIARALVTEPKIIIADEPTAALDSVTAREIINLLRRINQEKNTTFIFSTHDTRIIEQVERRINLIDGKLSGNGTK
jgi:putative ABC transport system ATP-binding protein